MIETVELNVHCMVLSERVWLMCCGSVLVSICRDNFQKVLKQLLLGARYAEFEGLVM